MEWNGWLERGLIVMAVCIGGLCDLTGDGAGHASRIYIGCLRRASRMYVEGGPNRFLNGGGVGKTALFSCLAKPFPYV